MSEVWFYLGRLIDFLEVVSLIAWIIVAIALFKMRGKFKNSAGQIIRKT